MKQAVLVLLIALLGSSLSVPTGEAQPPQPGPVGGDLGGYYSQFWETPEPIHHNDSQFLIEGRSYYVSPAAYRVNQQLSVDGEPFINFGVMWYTKVLEDTGR